MIHNAHCPTIIAIIPYASLSTVGTYCVIKMYPYLMYHDVCILCNDPPDDDDILRKTILLHFFLE